MKSKIDIEFLSCGVCKKPIRKKRIYLNIKEATLGRQDVCICEKCFFNIPEGLHRLLISNSSMGTGDELNTVVVGALCNLKSVANLNKGWVLLSKNHFFNKVSPYTVNGRELITSGIKSLKVLYVFRNGKIVLKNF